MQLTKTIYFFLIIVWSSNCPIKSPTLNQLSSSMLLLQFFSKCTVRRVTCGSEPLPAHSAGPEPLWAPPGSADSSGLLSPTSRGGKPGSTARWFDPAAAGWTCTGSHRPPPATTGRNKDQREKWVKACGRTVKLVDKSLLSYIKFK